MIPIPRPSLPPGACQDCGTVHFGSCFLANSILSRLEFVESQLPYRYEPLHPMPPCGPSLLQQLDEAIEMAPTPTHVYVLDGHPWLAEMERNREVAEDDGC